MGRKMKLVPFLFKPMEPPSSSWPWAACGNPKTLSFRAEKTMNPVYVNEDESRLTDSSEFESAGGSIISTTTELEEEESGGGESIENVIRGLTRPERLFFEPGTSSLLGGELQQAAAKTNIISTKDGLDIPIKENSFVVMEMESRDPFVDFKKSMEEMVEAHGLNYLKDWECLEELLNWYLRVNGKCNHGYIVGAFVDLLVALDFPTFISSPPPHPCDDTFTIAHSPISALSFSSSTSNSSTVPCLSSLEEAHDDHNKEKRVLEDDHEASSNSNV